MRNKRKLAARLGATMLALAGLATGTAMAAEGDKPNNLFSKIYFSMRASEPQR